MTNILATSLGREGVVHFFVAPCGCVVGALPNATSSVMYIHIPEIHVLIKLFSALWLGFELIFWYIVERDWKVSHRHTELRAISCARTYDALKPCHLQHFFSKIYGDFFIRSDMNDVFLNSLLRRRKWIASRPRRSIAWNRSCSLPVCLMTLSRCRTTASLHFWKAGSAVLNFKTFSEVRALQHWAKRKKCATSLSTVALAAYCSFSTSISGSSFYSSVAWLFLHIAISCSLWCR